MDHAEAHERLADLALEPRRLLDLEADRDPEAMAILAHVATCDACRSDLDAWRQTHQAVFDAAEETSLGALDPDMGASGSEASPPDALRAAVANIPRRSPRLLDAAAGRSTSTGRSTVVAQRARTRWPAAAMAAALVVALVIGLGGVALDQAGQADTARRQVGELAEHSSSIDRVLHGSEHAAIALIGLDGAPAGTAAWSSDEIVVMSTALAPPDVGAEYRCWVERDGQRTPIGVMRFANGVAYWSGSLGRYEDLSLEDGRLGVSLEQAGQDGSGAPVLLGELPS